MGRYSRAIYGAAKYGLDLWTEQSVEPMAATIEVSDVFSHTSSTTDDYGTPVYDRVQVSWLKPQNVDRTVLMRSNVGYPTGPTDPFSATLYDTQTQGSGGSANAVAGNLAGQNSAPQAVPLWPSDPFSRARVAYLDRGVEPGREYFYTVWNYVAGSDDWIMAGRASVTTSSDHGLVEAFRSALPAYIWNVHSSSSDGVDTLPDPDPESHLGRFLQSFAWDLDKTLTKADLLRQVWDPQRTPAAVLDDAVDMFGLPNEPALGARAYRALLANASVITGERGSLKATELLVESLTGYWSELAVGGNIMCSTDESSFEGMTVVSADDPTVIGGTGRWYFSNAKKTRTGGDSALSTVQIARSPNSDETDLIGSTASRFGLRLDALDASKDVSMTLGERIKVTKLSPLEGPLVKVTTAWVHGLEVGDKVSLTLDGGATSGTVTVLAVLDNFNVRVDAPAAYQGFTYTPADGYLSGGMIPVYQGIPVQELKTYSQAGKFQGTTGASNFSLKVTYWDGLGNQLNTVTASASALAASPAWTSVAGQGAAEAGAVSATISITLSQTGGAQWLGVDSLMLKEGASQYTYEDARLLSVNITPSKTPSNGPVPISISGDRRAVLEARLTSVLAGYLPYGTAFRINWL